MSIQPHKTSFFQVRGILVGKSSPKFLRTGELTTTDYQAVNFGVKTSPDQIVYVEKFGTKNDKAYAYNKNEKKTLELAWDKRNDKLPNGYRLITPDWDIIEQVKNDFNDGDSIVVNGELDFQEYNNSIITKQVIRNIYKATQIVDFEAEGFVEEAIFSQEVTVDRVEFIKDEGKIYLYAFVFKSRGKDKPINVLNAVFTVYPDKNKKFANKIMKLKYGDTVKFDGIIHSRLEKFEVESDDEWGTTHSVGTRTKKEYEIIGAHADTYQAKLYKEKDIQEALEALQPEKMFGEDSNEDSDDNLFNDEDVPFLD